MMAPKRAREAPNTLDVIPDSLPVSIPGEVPETPNKTDFRYSMEITAKIKDTAIQQSQILCQN